LQALQINLSPLVELDVWFWKIVSDNPDDFYRAEETGSDGCVAGRAAEQARVLRLWCFDRIQGGRADNSNAHAFEL